MTTQVNAFGAFWDISNDNVVMCLSSDREFDQWKYNAISRIFEDRGYLRRSLDFEDETYEKAERLCHTLRFKDDMDMRLVKGILKPCYQCNNKFSINDCDCCPFVCIDCVLFNHQIANREECQECLNFCENCECYPEPYRCIDCGDWSCEGNGACGMYRGFGIPPEPCDCCMRVNCVCREYESDDGSVDPFVRHTEEGLKRLAKEEKTRNVRLTMLNNRHR